MAYVRFGNYTFPGETFHTSVDNFADVAARSDRLAGMDGGFDVYATGRAPSEIGRVSVTFTLVAASRSDMTAKRDAVRRMASWGVRRLWKQPTNPSDPARWCWARVVSIAMPERHGEYTDLHQPVTVIFQASEPRWYSKAGMWYLDGTVLLDTSGTDTLQGAAAVEAEDGDIITVTNSGSTPTRPRIMVEAVTSGVYITDWQIGDPYVLGELGLVIGDAPLATVQGFGMRRLDDSGRVLSEWFWLGTVTEGEQLIIDHAAYAVRYEADTGSANGYPDFYATVGFAFPPLLPGANRFQIFGTFTGKVKVTIDFLDAWS